MRPLLSICCTTFNHVKYVKETIEGFLTQQTNFPIEIIIHDDASTDGTADIIKEYASKDDRIVTILQDENQYSKKIKPWRNFVFPKAKGKYIALCEGDDYWTDPLKLQKQVDFLEANNDFALCFHNSKKYFQGTDTFEINTASAEVPNVTTSVDLADYNYIATPTVVMRNDFKLSPWFDLMPVGDWPLFFIQVQDKKIMKLDDYMCVYRIHDKGIWSSASEQQRLEMDINTIKPILDNVDLPKVANTALNKKYKEKVRALKKLNKKPFFSFKHLFSKS
ncbi:glycosyltransferase family 2 protein [Bizionia gelidisalsuginis]|uniref:Glycosyltransferase family 2 protein n=2 Tax=Bizionia TaxID=283785 RepID=A0A8H2QKM6_9FLAO|nr:MULTISPECIES: glycosyltransferase family 2 protein [Bizionia]TYB80255.1 glycosyltransferase family 2 protein [Bizionia saleffrena]TYC17098.1 glycosyltransferase family 2 protein [Bizionia gelidisalsuginis]